MENGLMGEVADRLRSWIGTDSEFSRKIQKKSLGEPPENKGAGDSEWAFEEPEEIPVFDKIYYAGDDILMSAEPGRHFHSIHMDHDGSDVEIIGARPYSGIDGVLVRYLSEDNEIREGNSSLFRLAGEQEQELVGDAYGGSVHTDRVPASLRDDDVYTPDLADGMAWLEGEGQAERRQPLSTLYSTKDTRELLLDRLVFRTEDSWPTFNGFLNEAWLKYAEDIGEEPDFGRVYTPSGFDSQVYALETEEMDFPVRFEAENRDGVYVVSPLDDRLSQSEELKLLNLLERTADVAGRYDIEGYGSGEYVFAPENR